jgi:hypothetical protein
MITLRESLLGNTREKVAGISDIVQITEIRDKLVNSGWYGFGKEDEQMDIFKIYKKNGKWFVDVDCGMNCYGTPDGGMTDGTFRFGTVNGYMRLTSAPSDSRMCQIRSLKYGPQEVKGNFEIWENEHIKDLKDCPKYVHEGIIVYGTPITTLKYFPIFVGGSVMIHNCRDLKKLTDTKDCEIRGMTVEFKGNGFVSNELSFRDLNWNIRCGSRGYRFDKSIADMN